MQALIHPRVFGKRLTVVAKVVGGTEKGEEEATFHQVAEIFTCMGNLGMGVVTFDKAEGVKTREVRDETENK